MAAINGQSGGVPLTTERETSIDAQAHPLPVFHGRGPRASRIDAGKAARRRVPRSRLADCELPHRDGIALLEASNEGRLAELIPIRYGRMVASPFGFYRGAAALMAFDLAQLPHTDIFVQLTGDAHLANFGLFASPERRVLFGPNDFDETLPGPFDWDVRRLAVSFVVAARERGFGAPVQSDVVRRFCATFRHYIDAFSEMDVLDVWYHQFTADSMLAHADSPKERRMERAVVTRARNRTSHTEMEHSTARVGGRLRIKDDPPLVYHYPVTNRRNAALFDDTVRHFIADFRDTLPDERRALFDRYELVDIAVRVVGVGSVGTRCWVALFMAEGKYPLFLQIKEARASVLERYLPPSRYANHGQRVVTGQRLLQSASDIFLGWATSRINGTDFYVRQLRDMKGAFDLAVFDERDLSEYAALCGHALAHAMAKSGDPALIAGYAGSSEAFDDALTRFSTTYADRNERDWMVLKSAVKAGRIRAIRE
ncbi:DUF2252 domain-containing protein [Paraburkholderia rhizosphaerae]|uniref:Uncharacterized protein (DUF2252 family) n=1 Tax=Paraburkholderia rhizosphaerae TaxID=480658 RepID=A0A4R8LHF4_9BURK|nr:DUF2252 domain-containing protein [Paraburkholderia rhizosphaerae]TDY42652.1 uncharacterized protein (DUF2252 family) [Paraburkholderia rhizosphaerae]